MYPRRWNHRRTWLAALMVLCLVGIAQAQQVAKTTAPAASKAAPAADKTAPTAKRDSYVDQIERANALAQQLLALDMNARVLFELDHPGILPESKLRLPKETVKAFDWCNLNKVSEAHRQRSEDCWANAAIQALECNHLIRNNRRFELSPQPVLDNLKLGAEKMSGNSYDALDFLMKHGTARLTAYPYTGKPAEPKKAALLFRAVAWGFVAPDAKQPSVSLLKQALLQHGPLAVSLLSTTKFDEYKGGLFEETDPPNPDHVTTNHAVLLVGWDDTRGPHGAWKIKNDWNPNWGEQGFMWIAYGSNNVGRKAVWVQSQCLYYQMPAEFAALVPNAAPLPTQTIALPLAAPATPADTTVLAAKPAAIDKVNRDATTAVE